MMLDLVVVGAGPAGLALAGACAREGLSVAVVAPEPEAPWVPSYGAWAGELPDYWREWAEAVWPEVVVHLDETRRHDLRGPYVRVHGARLQAALLASVPDRRRGGFEDAPLAGDLPPAAMASAMLGHFGRLGWSVRRHLVAGVFGSAGLRLVDEVFSRPARPRPDLRSPPYTPSRRVLAPIP